MKSVLFIFLQLLAFCVWGQFGTPVVVSKPSVILPSSIDLGDIDGDGLIDMVVAGGIGSNFYGTEKVTWLKNRGNNNFHDEFILSTEKYGANNVKCTDIDLDGDIDIIYSDFIIQLPFQPSQDVEISALNLLRNDGFGSFEHSVILENIKNKIYFFLEDIDNDGYQDIVTEYAVIESNNDTLFPGYFLNSGSGSFNEYHQICNGYLDRIVWSGDFNNDQISDFVQKRTAGFSNDTVNLFLSFGAGLYEKRQLFSNANFFTYTPTIKDINNDGYLDMLYARQGIKIRYGNEDMLWNEESTFLDVPFNDLAVTIYSPLNDDEFNDILLLSSNNIYLYTIGEGNTVLGLDTLDFNSDQKYVINNFENGKVYLNSFSTQIGQVYFTEIAGDSLLDIIPITNEVLPSSNIDQFEDINSDGILDLITANELYVSDGLERFDKININSLNINPNRDFRKRRSVLIKDFNLDGINDIVYYNNLKQLIYSHGTDFAQFDYQSTLFDFNGVDNEQLRTIDFVKLNEDVNELFLVVSSSRSIKIFQYQSSINNFNLLHNISIPENLDGFEISDFEGDGDLDFFLFHKFEGEALVYINDGNLSFNLVSYQLGTIGCLYCLIEDVNLDGFKDIVRINYSSDDNGIDVFNYSNNLDLFQNNEYFTSGSGAALSDAIFSDVDSDGNSELVFLSSSYPIFPNLSYLESSNEQVLGEATIINDSLFGRLSQVYKSDYDNDGDVDLFVISYETQQIILFPNLTSQPLNIAQTKEPEGLFELSPNPNQGVFQVQAQDGMQETLDWEMVDLTGRVIFQGRENQNMFTINASHLSQGIYLLKMRTTNGTQYKIERVVIQ